MLSTRLGSFTHVQAVSYSRSMSDEVEFAPSRSIEVRRSKRRKRTVSATREGNVTVIHAPYRISVAELNRITEELIKKLDSQEQRATSNERLLQRASHVSVTYLGSDFVREHPGGLTIKWVSNQTTRWGSCSPHSGTIRITDRLQKVPDYVLDAVILHELIHLIVPNHGPDFYILMNRYEHNDRANAYLDGFTAGLAETS